MVRFPNVPNVGYNYITIETLCTNGLQQHFPCVWELDCAVITAKMVFWANFGGPRLRVVGPRTHKFWYHLFRMVLFCYTFRPHIFYIYSCLLFYSSGRKYLLLWHKTLKLIRSGHYFNFNYEYDLLDDYYIFPYTNYVHDENGTPNSSPYPWYPIYSHALS